MKQVYYVGQPDGVLPHLADGIVGDGFENVIRATDLWSVKDECDLFCFPDIGFTGEQAELVRQGKPVWGHHGADELEWNKAKFLRTLGELGMELPPHRVARGMAALRELLFDSENVYVKISRWRGDWETFHWRNRVLDEANLDAAAYRLGSAKEMITFYVFDAIEAEVEDGIDTWCINGQWPKRMLHGMERKDRAFLGAIQGFDAIAEEVRGVNEKFGTVLGSYGYKGAFSTEVRLNDKAYFIDPTCRFGSPPSQLQTALITNLPEVIWRGANGELVEPESDDIIGAQVLITSDREKCEWLPFEMPEELRPWVKSSFACEIRGTLTIAPNPLENWAGWLVATGGTIKEVVETLKERKALLPAGFDCDLTGMCDLLRELEAAEEKGVELTDGEIPEPAIALDDA